MKTSLTGPKSLWNTRPFDMLNKRFEKMPGPCQKVMTTWLNSMKKQILIEEAKYCSCPCRRKLLEREIAQKEIEVESQALDAWRNLKIFPK